MPGLNISNLRKTKIEKDVLRMISHEAAFYYQMLPFSFDGKILKVALVHPDEVTAREALKFIGEHKNIKIEVAKIPEADFKQLVKQYSSLDEEVGEALGALEKELKIQKKTQNEDDAEIKKLAQEAPITKMVAVILKHAVEGGASDIHIEPFEEKVRVRFRVDGILHSSLYLPKKIHLPIVSRIKILSNLKIDETRKPQDGRFRATVGGKKIDFRVSSLPTNHGEKVVMRLLDTESGFLELSQLGLRDHGLETVERVLKKTSGLILVTGPTGSGKSTTLYSMLKILNKEEVNIVTLEDPVEYWIEGISQSQVKPEIDYTFASGLRSILRQDPDVIMVGEIRDNETAELAIHAALTGHVVLSTLHTNDAIGAIPRLLDMGVEPFLLTSALNIIIAQRLTRKIAKFDESKVAPPDIQELFKKEMVDLPPGYKIDYPIKLVQPREYKGRLGIFEVLESTPQLEHIILNDLSEEALRKESKRQGVVTMKQDGLMKVLDGLISVEEILRVVES